MSTPIALAPSAAGNRRMGRSVLAVAAAFAANALLSLAADEILHLLDVYPPWGQPMHQPSLNALALGYRIVFGAVAGVVVARLAPRAPMRHAAILGAIGFAFGTLGAVAAVTRYAHLGPAWYPIGLAVTAFPAVWLGAAWYERRGRRA